MNKKSLTPEATEELLTILKTRFEKNDARHPELQWASIESRLTSNEGKLWSLYKMEETGGEPDVVGYDEKNDHFLFVDCSKESPKNRRSVCYDLEALESRKKFKPEHNAIDLASEMGIELLNEDQYRELQTLGEFDTTTSSWISTPPEIRKKGGALFGDFRFGRTFVYHNGAESYFGARGFRGILKV